MSVGYGKPAPKPEPRSRAKARRRRHEADIEKIVRAACVARDGHCRIGSATTFFGKCHRVSEWAHSEEQRRFKTRGQDAELRHTTAGSFMACRTHHQDYDEHRMTIEPLTERGADSTLRLQMNGISVLSLPANLSAEK